MLCQAPVKLQPIGAAIQRETRIMIPYFDL